MDQLRLHLKREKFRVWIRREKIQGLLRHRREGIVREIDHNREQLTLPEPNVNALPAEIESILAGIT